MLNKLHKGGEIQSDLESINETLKTKQKTLASNEQREKKLEGDRRTMEQREAAIEKKKIINSSLKWEKFKSLRKVVKETRDKKRQLEEERANNAALLEPIKTFLKEYDRKVKALREQADIVDKEFVKVSG